MGLCKHVFHFDCIAKIIRDKGNSLRLVFNYLFCPVNECKQMMSFPYNAELNQLILEGQSLLKVVKDKALQRAKHEGLDKDPRLSNINDFYYNNLQEFAVFKCAYYECFKCKCPYFGGLKDCNLLQQEQDEFKPQDLVCPGCAAIKLGVGVAHCVSHGTDFIDFKCKFCCAIACWFCWGTTHFCEPCHQVAGSNKVKPCKGPGQCDLGEDLQNHPENGTVEFALGCSLCRSNARKAF